MNTPDTKNQSPKPGTAGSTAAPCSEFSRPPKEVWRWYAWTRMKHTEPMRWIATCWKGDTKDEAVGKRERALREDVTLILVCELTTYIPNDPAQAPTL